MTLTENGAPRASSHPAALSVLDGTSATAALSSTPASGTCSSAPSTSDAVGAPAPCRPGVAAPELPQTPKRWPKARRGGRLSPQWRQILNALLEPAPAAVKVDGVTFSARKTRVENASTLAPNAVEVRHG